jgi:hypothetical protein
MDTAELEVQVPLAAQGNLLLLNQTPFFRLCPTGA